MKKVCLVAGGAGFIGSHLCDLLLQKNYKVLCLDSLITGSVKNLEHLKKNKNFRFLKTDVSGKITNLGRIDFIFHLASPASPVDYQNHPLETLQVNSLGTLNLLELARKNNAKFLLASTSEVYGDPQEHPQKETYWGNVNSFGPRSCYDESKRFAEAAVYVYLHEFDTDARILRIFNTYGPRMQKDDGRVVSNFINQAIKNKPLTIYGTGRQTRSFCFVADLVAGIAKAMLVKKTKGVVFNLGNPTEYKILDFAQKIKKLTKSKSKIIFQVLPKDDPQQRRPDIAKAIKVLNWKPQISLEQGLKETIKYYRGLD